MWFSCEAFLGWLYWLSLRFFNSSTAHTSRFLFPQVEQAAASVLPSPRNGTEIPPEMENSTGGWNLYTNGYMSISIFDCRMVPSGKLTNITMETHTMPLMGKLTISVAMFKFANVRHDQAGYPLVMTKWKMAIEIVDFPINSMVMFHSYVKSPEGHWKKPVTINHLGNHRPHPESSVFGMSWSSDVHVLTARLGTVTSPSVYNTHMYILDNIIFTLYHHNDIIYIYNYICIIYIYMYVYI